MKVIILNFLKHAFSFIEKIAILYKVISITLKNNTNLRNIVLIPALVLVILCSSFKPTGIKLYKIDRIVIDAGHGGKDPGTQGGFSREKDVSLKIARELGRIIKENYKDIKVIYTRDADKFIELENRANIANKNDADLFISIHCNAVPKNKDHIFGTETYVMSAHASEGNFEVAKRENSVILLEDNYKERYEGFDPSSPESLILFSLYQNAYIENSLKLASKVEEQFSRRVGRNSHGVKQAGFWVLWRTSMPSILIEVGFLSNPKEERYLNDDLGQVYLASGIFRAFKDYKGEIESDE
jgi:N-acetylmuramoyl-L-alanine amidase